MQYLTSEEYLEYGGKLDENDFTLFEFRARKTIDYLTDSRVAAMSEVPEAVKLCMMQLDTYNAKYGAEAKAASPVVASFSTDGYSESYGSLSEQEASARQALHDSIRTLLYGETDDNGTPLLYRGVYT